MATPLQWVFKLFDKLSAPADAMAAATRGVTTQLDKATTALDKTERAAKSTGTAFMTLADHMKIAQGFEDMARNVAEASLSLEQHQKIAMALSKTFEAFGKLPAHTEKVKRFGLEWGNVMHSFAGLRYEGGEDGGPGKLMFNVAEGARFAYEQVHRVAETFKEWGVEAIHAAAGAERSADSIKGLLGATEGGEVLEYLEAISKHTEFDDSELRQLTIALADAGFEAADLQKALPAALDIAALRGGGIGNAMGAVGVFERVKLSGAIDKRSLRKLGIEAKPFFDDLGAELGMTAKGAQEKAAAGGLDPERLINSLYRAISAKEGGPIGTLAIKGSQSLDALWNKLGKLKENLFEGLADGKAIGQFKGFLSNILTAMDPSSEFGKDIIKSLDSIFGDTLTSLFGDLSGPEGIEKFQIKVKEALDYIRDSIPSVKAAFSDFLVIVHATAKAIEAVAGAIATVAKNDDFNQKKKDAGGVEGAIYSVPFLRMAYRAVAEDPGSIDGVGGLAAINASIPQAHDFMWRGGEAIKFDPSDTVIGARGSRGDMLSAAYGSDTAGAPMGHGSTAYSVEVNINGSTGDSGHGGMSKEDVREAVYSAMEQFATEQG